MIKATINRQSVSSRGPAKQIAILHKVGHRIAAAVDEFYREKGLPNNFEWQYNLLEDDKVVNAWCMV